MMLEPFDYIVKPLVNQMSSEEDKYFTIPTDRNIRLRNIIEKGIQIYLKLTQKENNKTFGLFQKIKKNLGMLIDLRKLAQI